MGNNHKYIKLHGKISCIIDLYSFPFIWIDDELEEDELCVQHGARTRIYKIKFGLCKDDFNVRQVWYNTESQRNSDYQTIVDELLKEEK